MYNYGWVGSSYCKPYPGEMLKDWMYRCSFGVNCDPFLDDVHGWSSNTGFRPYPRKGTFDADVMLSSDYDL